MSACRSCGARVRWVKTVNGKPMPLDPQPSARGNIIVVDGIAKYVPVDDNATFGTRFVSHFATCPNAKSHRKTS